MGFQSLASLDFTVSKVRLAELPSHGKFGFSRRFQIFRYYPARGLDRNRSLPFRICRAGDNEHHEKTNDENLPLSQNQDGTQTPRSIFQTQNFQNFTLNSFFLSMWKWMMKHFVKVVVWVASILGALVWSGPLILSRPAGLHAALSFANALSPVLRVEVGSVDASWTRPLKVYDITVYEKNAQKRFPFSRVDSGNRHVHPKSSGESSSNIGTEEGKTDSHINSETPLVAIASLKTTGTLWNIVKGDASDVLLGFSTIELKFNENGQLRIAEAFQRAKLVPQAIPARGNDVEANNNALLDQSHELEGSTIPASLQRVDATVKLSAEIMTGKLFLVLSEARLLVPRELREAVGESIHIEIIRGIHAIKDSMSRRDLEWSAITGNAEFENHIEQGILLSHDDESSLSEAKYINDDIGSIRNERNLDKISNDDVLDWWEIPPRGVETNQRNVLGNFCNPVLMQVDSCTLHFSLKGWETSNKYTVLAFPILVKAELPPGLATLLVNRLNPLLGRTAILEPGSVLQMQISPKSRVWPSTELNIDLEPLNISIGQGSVIMKALDALSIADKTIGNALRTRSRINIETGHVAIEVSNGGRINAKKLDLSIGGLGLKHGLHVITWGTAHVMPNGEVDMTVALPPETLRNISLANLPEGYALGIKVTGPVRNPRLNLISTMKDIGTLLMEKKLGTYQGSSMDKTGWRSGLVKELNRIVAPNYRQLDSLVKVPE